MRLIDADEFIKRFCNMCETPTDRAIFCIVNGAIESQPTAYNVDSVVKEIEELTSYYKDCTKYGNKDAEQQRISYGTTLNYEVASYFDEILEIVKAGGKNE